MTIRQVVRKVSGLGLVLIAACGTTTSVTPSDAGEAENTTAIASEETTIVLGDVSDEPIKKIKRFQPLADYLGENLGEQGINTGEVAIVPDLDSMIAAMKAGEIDLYFDSLYPATVVSEGSGAEPILRRWKDGVAEYNTVFFTRVDSNINQLEDLSGKHLALEEKFSTSGYLLPVSYLLQSNLNPVEKSAITSPVAANEIGYVFTRDDENTIQWVVSGRIEAGAIDNQSFAKIPEETRSQLRIFAETAKIPRQLVLIAPDITPEQREEIKKLLIALDQTEAGQKVLEQLKETEKFDEFNSEDSIAKMRELYDLVKNR
jgi:phosphonate transport system substrate-binding protein